LIAKSYYAELVLSTPLLCPRHPSPHLLEEICGSVALVVEHDTFMPGEVVVDKYDPQIFPRPFLYIVNNGSVLIRRGSTLFTCARSFLSSLPCSLSPSVSLCLCLSLSDINPSERTSCS
jgi:hypothetical protein